MWPAGNLAALWWHSRSRFPSCGAEDGCGQGELGIVGERVGHGVVFRGFYPSYRGERAGALTRIQKRFSRGSFAGFLGRRIVRFGGVGSAGFTAINGPADPGNLNPIVAKDPTAPRISAVTFAASVTTSATTIRSWDFERPALVLEEKSAVPAARLLSNESALESYPFEPGAIDRSPARRGPGRRRARSEPPRGAPLRVARPGDRSLDRARRTHRFSRHGHLRALATFRAPTPGLRGYRRPARALTPGRRADRHYLRALTPGRRGLPAQSPRPDVRPSGVAGIVAAP